MPELRLHLAPKTELAKTTALLSAHAKISPSFGVLPISGRYEAQVKAIYKCLDGYQGYTLVPTSTTNEDGTAAHSYSLLAKQKPWSCSVMDLPRYGLTELVAMANNSPVEGEVASFMNVVYGYDEFEMVNEDDHLYLYGKDGDKKVLIARVCNDTEYKSIKDKVYEEWLMEPLRTY